MIVLRMLHQMLHEVPVLGYDVVHNITTFQSCRSSRRNDKFFTGENNCENILIRAVLNYSRTIFPRLEDHPAKSLSLTFAVI